VLARALYILNHLYSVTIKHFCFTSFRCGCCCCLFCSKRFIDISTERAFFYLFERPFSSV